jgi:hypothetical protein
VDTDSSQPEPRGSDSRSNQSALWQHVREALRGMQFGTVTLVVQDGRVIQVDRTEKRRLPRQAIDI